MASTLFLKTRVRGGEVFVFVLFLNVLRLTSLVAYGESLRHVAMVAKFLDARHLKGKFAPFQTSSIFFNFIYLIRQIWRNFLGLNPKGPFLRLEKEREDFCVVFTYSMKRAREIKKFRAAAVR